MLNRRIKTQMACGVVAGLSVGLVGPVAMASEPTPSVRPVGPTETVAANATVSVEADPPRTVVRRGQAPVTRRDLVTRRPSGDRAWYTDGLMALAVVLGMIVAAALAVKKWGGKVRMAVGGGGENLEMVSRLAISPKQSVCLIRLGQQMVLVGVTPDQISPLSIIDDPETVGELLSSADRPKGEGVGAGFNRWFANATSSYENDGEAVGPAAEIPLAGEDGHYRQARMELSGLLDKVRRRDRSMTTEPADADDGAGHNTIAIA